jgi:5'-methylthioadenosine phosphorylase
MSDDSEIPTCLVGVIGGSGMYEFDGLEDVREIDIAMTPFGCPSAAFTLGTLHGVNVAFLTRHGIGHTILPHELPSRANIYAFKQLGVKWLISVSACGSLREEIAPGHLAIPEGLYDHTSGRDGTFFGNGAVAHVSLANPFCPVLSKVLLTATTMAVDGTEKKVHFGGQLITINGPRFSTKTESRIYRQQGLDLINMTTAPEAALAMEAEIGCVWKSSGSRRRRGVVGVVVVVVAVVVVVVVVVAAVVVVVVAAAAAAAAAVAAAAVAVVVVLLLFC